MFYLLLLENHGWNTFATIPFYSLYRAKFCSGLHKIKIYLLNKRIMSIYRFYLLLCVPGISYLKTDENCFLTFFIPST